MTVSAGAARLETLLSQLADLVDVGQLVDRVATEPEQLQDLFATYIAEALFFRRVLEPELSMLEPGSRVVEIGSGIGLLARHIAAEGHTVIAFEPEAAGFGRMRRLSDLLDASWRGGNRDITFHHDHYTGHELVGAPNLIIAMHVIEHVKDPAQLIINATRSLAPKGSARFVCPNYAFPYEPHFEVPTVVNKRWTRRLARRVIARSPIADAQQFWDDLSWPSVRRLRRALRDADVDVEFSRRAIEMYVRRLDESAFVDRKGRAFRTLSKIAPRALVAASRRMPIAVVPIIDLTTRKTS